MSKKDKVQLKNNLQPKEDLTTNSDNNLVARIILAAIILFVTMVRARLISFPFERDEGEYAYMGQLMLHGVMPYTEAYNMKFPGVHFSYAIIESIFGQTVWGIHFALILINIASILLLYKIAAKILGKEIYASIACIGYGLSALSYTTLGFAAHATHFVVLMALIGIYLLQKSFTAKRPQLMLMASGVFFGLSYIMKQSGFFFFFFGGSLIIINELTSGKKLSQLINFQFIKKLVLFGFSAFFPFLLMISILFTWGDIHKFYFWTFVYATNYGNQVPLNQAFETFMYSFGAIKENFGYFWLLAVVGTLGLFLIKEKFYRALTVFLFALFSFIAVCPGFYFRQHYFIHFLPALGVSFAAFFVFLDWLLEQRFKMKSLSWLKYAVVGLLFIIVIKKESWFLFKEKPIVLSRTIYGTNPFVEAIKISDYIKQHSNPEDKIAVMGSEPEIFFYSNRRSATGYIYTYNLMEDNPYSLTMQKEMISEVEKNKPKFMLFVNVSTSWLNHKTSEQFVFGWINKYITENFKLVAISDINGYNSPFITENINTYQPQSKEFITIYERKN